MRSRLGPPGGRLRRRRGGGDHVDPGPQQSSAPKGEKSIENFGEAATGATETSIVGVFKDYFRAIIDEDPAAACEYVAANVKESLQQIAGKGRQLECAQILPQVLAPTAPTIAHEQLSGEIKRVRVEGDRAFVVFHAPGAKLYMLALRREDGAWKATTIASSVLVPQL